MVMCESNELPATLREDMKSRCWGLHGIADKLLEGALLEKKMTLGTLKIYTASLYHIYKALEKGMDTHSERPQLEAIYFPEVQRKHNLEQDLAYFYGNKWEEKIPLLPPVARYVEHLDKIAEEDPVKLAAHAYVRYFGDVSGGQILKRVISRMYKLPNDGSGVQFYDFSEISDIKQFKALFTSRLEALELDAMDRETVVEESRVSFQLNIDVIRAIDSIIDQEQRENLLIKEGSATVATEKSLHWYTHCPIPGPQNWIVLGISAVGLASLAAISVLSNHLIPDVM